jgi:hypothetical protein
MPSVLLAHASNFDIGRRRNGVLNPIYQLDDVGNAIFNFLDCLRCLLLRFYDHLGSNRHIQPHPVNRSAHRMESRQDQE